MVMPEEFIPGLDESGLIREAGSDVAIDDFSSGLSSLSFVKDVAVDDVLVITLCHNLE